MADILDITVTIKRNGQLISGFPRQYRQLVDEVQQFAYEKTTGGGYAALPTNQLDAVQILALTADQAVTVRLDGQSDAGISLNANGLLLIVDGNLDAGVSTNATLDNSSGSTATISGIGGGT